MFPSLLTKKNENDTSFQDFPCAKRGYTGAFGLMKVTLFEWAMSFGCIVTQKMQNHAKAHTSYPSWYAEETENGKTTGSDISDPKI